MEGITFVAIFSTVIATFMARCIFKPHRQVYPI